MLEAHNGNDFPVTVREDNGTEWTLSPGESRNFDNDASGNCSLTALSTTTGESFTFFFGNGNWVWDVPG